MAHYLNETARISVGDPSYCSRSSKPGGGSSPLFVFQTHPSSEIHGRKTMQNWSIDLLRLVLYVSVMAPAHWGERFHDALEQNRILRLFRTHLVLIIVD